MPKWLAVNLARTSPLVVRAHARASAATRGGGGLRRLKACSRRARAVGAVDYFAGVSPAVMDVLGDYSVASAHRCPTIKRTRV